MSRYVVVEIAANGDEDSDDVKWETRAEADEERYALDRVARYYWPSLGFRYEVREVPE